MTRLGAPSGTGQVRRGDPVRWQITRNGSIATAFDETVGTDHELRICLGNEELWSRRYGPDVGQRLHQDALTKLAEFLSLGWVVVRSVSTAR